MTAEQTVTKDEISDFLSSKLKLNKQISKKIVEKIFEEIPKNLEKGRPVRISGFGNFELKDKKPRPGRNPKTGVPKVISARRVVTFKAGQKLKTKLQEIQEQSKD